MYQENQTTRILDLRHDVDAVSLPTFPQRRHQSPEELRAAVLDHQARIDAARRSGAYVDGEDMSSERNGRDCDPGWAETPRGIELGNTDTLALDVLKEGR